MLYEFEVDRRSVAAATEVTLAWCALFVVFLAFQALSKWFLVLQPRKEADSRSLGRRLASVKYNGKGGKLGLTGDRTVGNMMEQSLLFLPLLWLHALLVNGETAAFWGWAWLASRAPYPALFFKGVPWLFISTFGGYACLVGLMLPLRGAAGALVQ